MARPIAGCPCGTVHVVSDRWLERYRRTVGRAGENTLVGNMYGAYWIPRTYLAFHPDRIAERLTYLARQYGWPVYQYEMPRHIDLTPPGERPSDEDSRRPANPRAQLQLRQQQSHRSRPAPARPRRATHQPG